jgi:nicotinamide-nucleotide amidase
MKIAIISTGDELLRGATVDTNASWIAARLHERGHETSRITVIGDDLPELAAELTRGAAAADLLIVGGGLGPTDDDLTARAAASAFDRPIARVPEAATQVQAAFARLGRPMLEINLKQADLPAGCRVLENLQGTAPGFELDTDRGRAIFLPGVPRELEPMFERHVLPTLPAPDRARHTALLRCFGVGESNIQALLHELTAADPELRIAFRASFLEIGVTLRATTAAALESATARAGELLGRAVFAREEIDLPTAFGRAAAARGVTVATAESCTGGLIGHALTAVPGSSGYYRGGVVAYDNDIKIGLLGVDRALIERHGAVSEQVVTAMAAGARRALDTDLALATSGIAGPDGGTTDKPVGLVQMAVAHRGGVAHREHVFAGFTRERVKRAAAWSVMRMALDILMETHP